MNPESHSLSSHPASKISHPNPSNSTLSGQPSSVPSSHIPNNTTDDDEEEENRVVETDPTGRFERYATCLGKGAYKEVFKAFDQEEGVEVAWNQLRLDTLNKRDVNNILSEIRILESLRNDNIINLYYSWTSRGKDNKERIIFITEHMTSGTLKNYIRKTKGSIKPKVLKNWCRQILSGLAYLHSRDPPIIHRDLKCENIFINGNNGQAKIGDLGLATVKSRDHMSSVLGTPEFMAPELYDESYDEKVDIYAFGMVVLEIVTKEYPYSECSNQAQIYKKVTSGIKPLALSKIMDDETRLFIDWCITSDKNVRPSAIQVMQHPFLSRNASVVSLTSLHSGMLMENSVGSLDWASPIADVTPRIPTSQEYAAQPGVSGKTAYTSTSSGSSVGTVPSDRKTSDAKSLSFESASKPIPSLLADHVPLKALSDTRGDDAKSDSIHSRSGSIASSPKIPAIVPETSRKESDVVMEPMTEIPSQTVQLPVETSQTVANPQSNAHVQMEVTERKGDSEVVLKLSYSSTGKHNAQEIKFPFNLSDDTATDVVSEMVNENLIEAKDEQLARRKLEEVIRRLLMSDRTSVSSNMFAVQDANKGEAFPHHRSGSAGPEMNPHVLEAMRRVSEQTMQSSYEQMARAAAQRPVENMVFDPSFAPHYATYHSGYTSPPLLPQYHRSGSTSPPRRATSPTIPPAQLPENTVKKRSLPNAFLAPQPPEGSDPTPFSSNSSSSSRPITPTGNEYAVNPLTGQWIPLHQDDMSPAVRVNRSANPVYPSSFQPSGHPSQIKMASPKMAPTTVESNAHSQHYYQRGVSTSSSTSAESNTSGSTLSQGQVHVDNEVGAIRRVVSIGAGSSNGPPPLHLPPTAWNMGASVNTMEASAMHREHGVDPNYMGYSYNPMMGYREGQPQRPFMYQYSYPIYGGRVELPPLPPQHRIGSMDGYVVDSAGYYYQRPPAPPAGHVMQRTPSNGSSTSTDVPRLPSGSISRVPLKDSTTVSPTASTMPSLPSLATMLEKAQLEPQKTPEPVPSDQLIENTLSPLQLDPR